MQLLLALFVDGLAAVDGEAVPDGVAVPLADRGLRLRRTENTSSGRRRSAAVSLVRLRNDATLLQLLEEPEAVGGIRHPRLVTAE